MNSDSRQMQGQWRAALARHFGDDLDVLLKDIDAEVVGAEELTRLVSRRQRKAVFKLELADGRLLKARRYKASQEAVIAAALTRFLDHRHYSRVQAALGTTTLEDWIPGSLLTPEAVTPEQAHRAGELLGQLHRTSGLPGPETSPVPTIEVHTALMEQHLAALVAQGALDESIATRICELAERTKPREFQTGLIHGDFCAENMILGPTGELVLIDNESLCVGALDFDVARAWCRWPMTRANRRAFTAGYTQYRELESFSLHGKFWALRALLMSAYVQLKHERPCQPVLEALQRLGSGAEDGFWASLPDRRGEPG
jgi:Ser/Thr protein kinase RdoA (MazF antagonist)